MAARSRCSISPRANGTNCHACIRRSHHTHWVVITSANAASGGSSRRRGVRAKIRRSEAHQGLYDRNKRKHGNTCPKPTSRTRCPHTTDIDLQNTRTASGKVNFGRVAGHPAALNTLRLLLFAHITLPIAAALRQHPHPHAHSPCRPRYAPASAATSARSASCH
jgi:hypothetical protein